MQVRTQCTHISCRQEKCYTLMLEMTQEAYDKAVAQAPTNDPNKKNILYKECPLFRSHEHEVLAVDTMILDPQSDQLFTTAKERNNALRAFNMRMRDEHVKRYQELYDLVKTLVLQGADVEEFSQLTDEDCARLKALQGKKSVGPNSETRNIREIAGE